MLALTECLRRIGPGDGSATSTTIVPDGGMMRSLRALSAVLLTTGAALFIAACGSDMTTGPAQPASRPLTPNPLASFDKPAPSGDVTVKFTIKAGEDLYVTIGSHSLYIPANVVCDPKSSGYGVAYWDLPCKTISGNTRINVSATASMLNGHPIVIFDTELRFKPTTDPSGFVMLYLRDNLGTATSRIFWCPDAKPNSKTAPTCVDETPKTLAPAWTQTRWDSRAGYIYRRIEHFSGYNVTAGDTGGDSTGMGGQ